MLGQEHPHEVSLRLETTATGTAFAENPSAGNTFKIHGVVQGRPTEPAMRNSPVMCCGCSVDFPDAPPGNSEERQVGLMPIFKADIRQYFEVLG